MKVLLVAVNAKYIHSNLAIYSLKAYADRYFTENRESNASSTPQLVIKECTINQQSESILKGIYLERPDVIALSVYIWNRTIIEGLLPELRKVLPQAKLWLGGPEVSFDLESQMQHFPMINGIMYGEGEATFAELIDRYWKCETLTLAEDLSMIRGIVYRPSEIDSPVTNLPRPVLAMDEIPFPYKDLKDFDNRIIYYETSRGCPFSCAYCLSSVEKKLRFRSMTNVSKELTFFLNNNVKQVKFVDRTFNCNHEHAMKILCFIQENDNGVTNFHFEIAGDILTEEEITLIRSLRPGLVQLELGVQSTNPKTLEAIDRRTDLDILKKNCELLLEPRNVHLHLDLIAGLPYENRERFAQSFNEVFAMNGDELQLGFLKLLNGAPMKNMAKEHGILSTDEPPYEILMTKYLSYDDVLHLKEVEEMLENYSNSGQFNHTLRQLLKEEESPFALFENLAAFYKKKGYPVISVSRLRRYEILLEYLEEKDDRQIAVKYNLRDRESCRIETYKELLTLDYYLRENAKKRPDFAPVIEGREQEVIDFFREEAQMHEFLHGYEGYDAKQLQKMTHTETFCHILSGDASETPCKIIFDYKRIHPITKEAALIRIPLHKEVRLTGENG